MIYTYQLNNKHENVLKGTVRLILLIEENLFIDRLFKIPCKIEDIFTKQKKGFFKDYTCIFLVLNLYGFCQS